MGPSFGGTQLASPGYSHQVPEPRAKETESESETDRVERGQGGDGSKQRGAPTGRRRPPAGQPWQESVRTGQGRDGVRGQGCHASYRESEG